MSNATQITKIKQSVKRITGVKSHVKDNGKFWTVSVADSTISMGFGHFREELAAEFRILRFDGLSFDVMK